MLKLRAAICFGFECNTFGKNCITCDLALLWVPINSLSRRVALGALGLR